MKTPDEIKKGLECCLGDCHNYHCDKCPYMEPDTENYDGCPDNGRRLSEDAIALIWRLEDENRQYRKEAEEMNAEIDALKSRNQQLEAERDALIDVVKDWVGSCAVCKHYAKSEDEFPCRFCAERFPEDEDKISHWERRGVQKED